RFGGYFPRVSGPRDLKGRYPDRIPNGLNLTFAIVETAYEGEYTCVASYRENGRDFSLTRTMRVKVVESPEKSTPPVIISPTKWITYELKPGEQLFLHCEVTFTFLKDSPQEVWWAIDGRHSDDITDFKFNVSTTVISHDLQLEFCAAKTSVT
uniref:Interleukin 1 receptor accessory protein n=1 Tax=Pseudonaja textilis TaxID=8673 RepID=A0A670YSQ8_PSETE